MDADFLNELAIRTHAANRHWWRDPITELPLERHHGEMMMLVVSEIAEAMEGHRRGLMDDKIPCRSMLEVEIADAFIRMLDAAGHDQPYRLLSARSKYLFHPANNVSSSLFNLVRAVDDVRSYRDVQSYSMFFATIEAFAANYDLDLLGAYYDKMAYNETREDHTAEARLAVGGKRY